MNLPRTLLLALALAATFTPPFVAAAATPLAAPDDDPAYTAGTRALNESRWSDAVASFDQVVEAKGRKADAALYWKAYALGKLDKRQLASDTCMQLRTHYRASPWNRDCAALRMNDASNLIAVQRALDGVSLPDFDFNFDFSGMSGMSGRSKDPDTDLKMLALNSLAHRDPAQAMTILHDILTGNQSVELKQHALFALTQSKSPEAQAMLHDVVLGKQGPALQRQAIQASALFQGKRGNDALAEVYRSTADPQVKRAVISAFFLTGDDARMVDLARAEKSMELKRTIVSQLSLMHGKAAGDYMMELLK